LRETSHPLLGTPRRAFPTECRCRDDQWPADPLTVANRSESGFEFVAIKHEDEVDGAAAGRHLASKLSANRLLLELREAGLQIVGPGGGVIQRAGVQPESFRLVAPGLVDGPLQEPLAKSLAVDVTLRVTVPSRGA